VHAPGEAALGQDAVRERHHGVHDGPEAAAEELAITSRNSALFDMVEPTK